MRELALRAASAASLLLLPALLPQGRRVRRDTPRLPDAAGPKEGVVTPPDDTGDRGDAGRSGDAAPIRLLVVGESTAAGVGAADHGEGLAGQVATRLAALAGRPVAWRVVARTGITAGGAARDLMADALSAPADVAVLAFGVNDTLRFHAPARWASDLETLIAGLRRDAPGLPVLLSAVPPMGRFPALPQPLRAVLGLRARVLDDAGRRLARRVPGLTHVPMPAMEGGDAVPYFCADRFHPGPRGYAVWGEAVAEAAHRIMR